MRIFLMISNFFFLDMRFNNTVPNLKIEDIPATGDNILGVIIVGLLSIIGIIICGFYLNKRENP